MTSPVRMPPSGTSGPDDAGPSPGYPPRPDLVERQTVLAWSTEPATILAASCSRLPGVGLEQRSLSVVTDGVQHSLHVAGCLDAPHASRLDEALAWSAAADGSLHLTARQPTWDLEITVRLDGDSVEAEVAHALGLDAAHTTRRSAALRAHGTVGEPCHNLTGRWPAVLIDQRGVVDLRRITPGLGPPLDELPRVWSLHLLAPVATTAGSEPPLEVGHEPGTRWPATISRGTGEAAVTAILLTRGLGIDDAWWEPGRFHDLVAIGQEQYVLDALDPTAVENLHVVALSSDGRLFEHLALGPHPDAGLPGFTDGA